MVDPMDEKSASKNAFLDSVELLEASPDEINDNKELLEGEIESLEATLEQVEF